MICVMAMNSQGNQAPHVPADTDESMYARYEEQRLRPSIDASVNPSDVLCGRGKSSFTHGKEAYISIAFGCSCLVMVSETSYTHLSS